MKKKRSDSRAKRRRKMGSLGLNVRYRIGGGWTAAYPIAKPN